MTDLIRIIDGTFRFEDASTDYKGVVVEAWRWAPTKLEGGAESWRGQLLGHSTIDEDGTFEISVPVGDTGIDPLIRSRSPAQSSIRFRVFRGSHEYTTPPSLPSSFGGVSGTWRTNSEPYLVAVSSPHSGSPPSPDSKVIKGVVSRPNGWGIGGLELAISKLGVADETAVVPPGSPTPVVTTDGGGAFSFSHALSGPADIVVRAKLGGTSTEVSASEVRYDVADFDRVYMTVDWDIDDPLLDPPTAFELLHASLDAKITALGGGITAMTGEKAAFQAEKRGLEAEQVARYVAARLLWSQAQAKGASSPLGVTVFFALLESGESASLQTLAAMEPSRLEAALATAVRSGAVPRSILSGVNGIATQFETVAKAELAPAVSAGKSTTLQTRSLTDLFLFTGPGGAPGGGWTDAQIGGLVNLTRSHTGDSAGLWAAWASAHSLSDGQVAAAKLRLHLGRIFLQHMGVLEALFALPGIILSKPNDIARLSESSIHSLIAGVITSTSLKPDGIEGTTTSEVVDNYTATVIANIERDFPSAAFLGQLQRDSWGGTLFSAEQADAKDFFDLSKNAANESIDLATTDLDAWFSGGSATFVDVGDSAKLLAFLKSVQRIYRTVPDERKYPLVKALVSANLTSAWRIQRLGRRRFLQLYATALGSGGVARRVFGRAQQQVAAALHTFTTTDVGFEGPDLPSLPTLSKATAASVTGLTGLPTSYTAMFGLSNPRRFLQPDHDESVLSPSAYLVDLLRFVQDIEAPGVGAGGTGDDHALTLLCAADRRPDIKLVELSVPNTKVLLPVIDLVNEVLEVRVAGTGATNPKTVGTAAELRASPARTSSAFEPAYDVLKTSVFPLQLPWSLWHEETRTFLDHLGVSRDKLVHLLRADPLATEWSDQACEEQLGLHEHQWACILARAGQLNIGGSAVPDEVRWGFASGTVGWLPQLEAVPEFVRRAGISQDELFDLVSCRFVKLEISQAGAPLDITKHVVRQQGGSALNAAEAIRAQSLIRLARLTGWTFSDVDRVIELTGAKTGAPSTAWFNANFRKDLAVVSHICKQSGLPVTEVLTIWGMLDIQEGRFASLPGNASLLTRAFTPPELTEPAVRAAFQLVPPPTPPTPPPPPELQAPGTDRYTLGNFTTSSEPSDPPLVYPHQPAVNQAVMAGLGVSREEYERLITLVLGSAAADRSLTLGNLAKLFGATRLARVVGRSVDDLGRLIRLIGRGSESPLNPANKTSTLQFIDAASYLAESSLSLDQFDWIFSHDPGSAERLGLTTTTLHDELRELWLRLLAEGPDAEEDRLKESLSTVVANICQVDRAVAAVLTEKLQSASATHGSMNAYLLDRSSGGFLYRPPVVSTEVPEPPKPEAVTEDSFNSSAWVRLRKVGMLVAAMGTDADETTALLDLGPASVAATFGLFEFNNLPVVPSVAEDVSVWIKTSRFFDLRAIMRNPAITWVSLLNAESLEAWQLGMAQGFDWNPADLSVLCAHISGTLGTDLPDEPTVWAYVVEVMETARRLGLNVAALLSLTDGTPDREQAEAARDAARSKHTVSTWQSVLTPIQDHLRELRRDRLVGRLMGNPSMGLHTFAKLYGSILVDPFIAADQLTSRLLFCTQSAQLFVHRCLAGEESVRLDQMAQDRWKWVKTYRVWEAARKVFLWPENWMEADLRREKTPLFDQMQSALSSEDLEDETTRLAYLTYLSGMNDLSRIEILAFVEHTEDDADGKVDVVYFFGKSTEGGDEVFWRAWKDRSSWTPWESVGTSVSSGHLIPVIHHGRLLLVWPTFDRTVDVGDQSATDSESEVAPSTTEVTLVQLHAIERRGDQWSSPIVSKDQAALRLSDDGVAVAVEPTDVFFRTAFPESEHQLREGTLLVTAWMISTAAPKSGTTPATCGLLACFVLDDCSGEFQVRWSSEVWGEEGKEYGANQSLPIDRPTGIPADTIPEGQRWIGTGTTVRLPTDPRSIPNDQPTVLRPELRPYKVLVPHDRWAYDADDGLAVYSDGLRSFLVFGAPEAARPDELSSGILDARAIFRQHPGMGFSPTVPVVPVVATVPTMRLGHAATQRKGMPATIARSASSRRVSTPRPRNAGTGAQTVQAGRRLSGMPSVRTATVTPVVDFGAGERLTRASHVLQQANASGLLAVPACAPLRQHRKIRFLALHHPYVCTFMAQVRRHGAPGLLNPDPNGVNSGLKRQALHDDTYFAATYSPSSLVHREQPKDDIDFDVDTPWGRYNWELFFHAPMLISERYRKEGRFEDALAWLSFVFNPQGLNEDFSATVTGATRAWRKALDAWRVKPLWEGTPRGFARIRELLAATPDEPGSEFERLVEQIRAWRDNPFDPHAIGELRTLAYKKWVVARYVSTLLDWGDMLFAQDSRETLNEAALLYVLAQELLGARPVAAKPNPTGTETPLTFAAIESGATPINRLEDLELVVGGAPERLSADSLEDALSGLESLIWFAIPANDALLLLWDQVEDRFFKLRNGYNLAGVKRSLPLFQPVLDPAVLVRAAAAGIPLSTYLTDATYPVPLYRFSVIHARAVGLAQSVKALGSALLQALEKKDAEQLGLLRSTHERTILALNREVRARDVEEAKAQLAVLESQRASATSRLEYYRGLIEQKLLKTEEQQLSELKKAKVLSAVAAGSSMLITALSAVLNGTIFFHRWKPWASVAWRSAELGAMLEGTVVEGLSLRSSVRSQSAGMLGIRSGHRRRMKEWEHQKKLAVKELETLDQQMVAAQLRIENAEQAMRIHTEQERQAIEVADYLRSKFTNVQLYDWQISQIGALHHQSYQLAYETARKAEAAFQYELGSDSTFVQYGYWNSLRKGLLAGEGLLYDLERMDAAYLEENIREDELTRHISLETLDPDALERLRHQGECYFVVPEALFDMDHPEHYFRRIKSVSLSIPAVVGKYSGVNARLTLQNSKYRRVEYDGEFEYAESAEDGPFDSRFKYFGTADSSIAISHAQEDSGLLQLDFGDPRYLPFERKGAVGTWRLSLTDVWPPFDRRSISDVVLHLRYTARKAGSIHSDAATEAAISAWNELHGTSDGVSPSVPGLMGARLALSMATDFPDAFHRFLHPEASEDANTLSFVLTEDALPFAHRSRFDSLTAVYAALVVDPGAESAHILGTMAIGGVPLKNDSDSDPIFVPLSPATAWGALLENCVSGGTLLSIALSKSETLASWELAFQSSDIPEVLGGGSSAPVRIDPTRVKDIVFILAYTLQDA